MSKNEIILKYEGQNFSNFKNDLSDALIEKIAPIGSEIKKLMNDKEYLNQVLQKGTDKAEKKSKLVLKEVYDIVGFVK
jgi:tryptophanyl-tRNA synthetase